MPHDPIQGQGHGDPKVAKMADFKVCLLCQYVHVIKRPMVNYDTSRQYLNCTDFWYLSALGITRPSNLQCPTFSRRILPLTRSRPVVPYGAYL